MRGVPHPSRHGVCVAVHGLHVVGQRDRWGAHVSGEDEEAEAGGNGDGVGEESRGVSKGKWNEADFLRNLTDLNPKLDQTQFADYPA